MTRIFVPSLILAGTAASLLCAPALADPSAYEQLQPILLTDVPLPCSSPARLTPPVAPADLLPLPAGGEWRSVGYPPTLIAPVTEYRLAAPVVTPGVPVEALRPVVAPAVPSGYVVGRGLLGQAKLYKPGQPVRNFLRYLGP